MSAAFLADARRHVRPLVVTEVALAVMLVVGAALLIRTSLALRAVDAGFDAHNVVTSRTSITATRFETRAGLAQPTAIHEGNFEILRDIFAGARANEKSR